MRLRALAVLIAFFAALLSGHARASDVAALTSSKGGISLVRVLSSSDVERYRDIHDLQKRGRWGEADRLISRLSDDILMGHVMAQRYLHPRSYRSKYAELKGWLERYADHPEAPTIYKLAMKRKARRAAAPQKPTAGSGRSGHQAYEGSVKPRGKRLNKSQRRRAAQLKRKIRKAFRNGWTKSAKNLIRSKEAKRLLGRVEHDEFRAKLGAAYFVDGRDKWALAWAGKAAKRSGKWTPEANWAAGLAAYRMGRYKRSAKHFESATRAKGATRWMASAAAFWAARAHLKARAPRKYNEWLGVASAYPRTFYGLLARRVLGLPVSFRWNEAPDVTRYDVELIAGTETGRRAMALVQVGQDAMAQRELLNLASQARRGLARSILALASNADMPALAVRLDARLHPRGGGWDDAAYPLPSWKPEDGYRVDRALIYAIARQESGFNPEAESWAGAKGLMQLMPGTASFVARDRSLRRDRDDQLFRPEFNLSLGQQYVEMLLDDRKVQGDLFRLAAAWNAGPGKLSQWWERKSRHKHDPLLFIEGLTSPETRRFIERVLANLWIYRDRLGQPTPSLDAIAAGEWPDYTPLDSQTLQVAEHGENRR